MKSYLLAFLLRQWPWICYDVVNLSDCIVMIGHVNDSISLSDDTIHTYIYIYIYIKSFRSHYGLGVDSASNGNEYQEHFIGVKAASA